MKHGFLPVSREDMKKQNIDQLDFVYVIGDAYVDHPSFGPAIISRLLEARGYTVGIIAQPDYRKAESIMALGEPRLGFLVSAGNMDSMVNHYTVAKKHRKTDAYTPGGEMGKRPDRAVIVYCNLIRQKYKHVPVIAGGIEASLRRLAHYDYWSDSMRRSILMESGADLISYGMGEHSIIAIADALDAGLPIREITYIPGTVCKVRSLEEISDYTMLPSYDEVRNDKKKYADYIKEITPVHNVWVSMGKAFLTGGLICVLGQFIMNWVTYMWDLEAEAAGTWTSIILVFLSALCTGLNIYQKLVKFGGAGALVPITGFANSVAAPAIEFRSEGQVFGIGVKIFTIAGPVILYGIGISWLLGVGYWILTGF